MISVLVADDQALIRAGIVLLLNAQPDLAVVAEAGDGAAAVALAAEHRPDVVIMDVRMPVLDGVAATRTLCADRPSADGPGPRVLMLTTFDDDEAVYGALLAGASGYLLKHAVPHDLVAAVHRVADGDAWLDPAVAGKVITALARTPRVGEPSGDLIARLTAREREVLVLMADGSSNAEIAERLVVGEGTIKTHVSRVLMKTGSRDRVQAVALAYRSGLVRA
ncbi:response regulator transcription factor [Microlunatus ginsengisoli]|uniref:Response regulator n=1 Tax=Microlunatus ginsengisoli TaxID=363863 RepID=A0ABP6ZYU1_9ACTN